MPSIRPEGEHARRSDKMQLTARASKSLETTTLRLKFTVQKMNAEVQCRCLTILPGFQEHKSAVWVILHESRAIRIRGRSKTCAA